MRRRGAHLEGPIRPYQGAVFLLGWARHQFDLRHAGSAVTVRRANAIRPCIAAANHQHVFALGRDQIFFAAMHFFVLRNQKFQREMHAIKIAARHRKVARVLRTACKDNRIKLFFQLCGRDGFFCVIDHALGQCALGHHHASDKLDTFGSHLRHTPIDQAFVQLEVRNAIAQQAANTIILFKHGYIVADTRELLRSG